MSEKLKRGWHWPSFEKILCGQMSEEALLGLPEHFVSSRFADVMPAIYDTLRLRSRDDCLALVENKSVSLPERIVAANILALSGDPRISTFAPAMVLIKGGSAWLGLDEDEVDEAVQRYRDLGIDKKWILKECPRHCLTLRDFRIAKYPVTNQEYREFLVDSQFTELPTSWAFRQYPAEKANHPVYTVSAGAAEAYAKWLSVKTNRSFRLPDEAEWEYAATGGDGREFPWGNAFEPDFANTAETGLFSTTPVGIFVEGNSSAGIADLAGNVEEYVRDDYAAYPDGTVIRDHLADANSVYRVARGGSFARFRDLARTRRRHGRNPTSHLYAMGFRLAEDIPG